MEESEGKCWQNSLHDGPLYQYLWIIHYGYKGRKTQEHRGVLCPTCAKSLSAWQLPAKKKKEQISEPK